MALVRWDPFRDLFSLQERMNRLFSDTLSRESFEPAGGDWLPAVDIYEDGDSLVFQAELPGVNKDDVEVQVEGNVLTLRGQRKKEKEVNGEQYHRVERYYGGFVRSFTLPTGIDKEKIRAEYRDGVLRLDLPKGEGAKPKKIKILAA